MNITCQFWNTFSFFHNLQRRKVATILSGFIEKKFFFVFFSLEILPFCEAAEILASLPGFILVQTSEFTNKNLRLQLHSHSKFQNSIKDTKMQQD